MKALTLGETIDQTVEIYARVAHIPEAEAIEHIILHLKKRQGNDKDS